ncbi:efflux ABC transporter permease/ATP-binding protein [Planoprotostelium fungivorum]|uniref:Efflux ABC transporter permease/ATP-binding protein n=1 Tax=Planoprotostelium fungivorum TaxID=1890364 RepID=A0A2P6NS16_9EUKA|nr:efflux ABC transporter permease/ATP-binding protein [Planoprotostelium fungivorum]
MRATVATLLLLLVLSVSAKTCDLNVGVTNRMGIYSVAVQLGFFERAGVSICDQPVAGSNSAFPALAAGNFTVLLSTIDNTVNRVVNQVQNVTIIAGIDLGQDQVVVGTKNIKSFADLQGTNIIVDSPTSGTAFSLNKILKLNGLLPTTNYTYIQGGNSQLRFEVLKTGVFNGINISAALILYPQTANIMGRTDMNVLGSLSDYLNPFMLNCVGVQTSTLTNSTQVELYTRFLAGLQMARNFVADPSNSAAVINAIAVDLNITTTVAARQYQAVTNPITGEVVLDLTISRAGLANVVYARQEFGGFISPYFNLTKTLEPKTTGGTIYDYTILTAAKARVASRATEEVHTEYLGADLSVVQTATPQECANLCKANRQCNAYTFDVCLASASEAEPSKHVFKHVYQYSTYPFELFSSVDDRNVFIFTRKLSEVQKVGHLVPSYLGSRIACVSFDPCRVYSSAVRLGPNQRYLSTQTENTKHQSIEDNKKKSLFVRFKKFVAPPVPIVDESAPPVKSDKPQKAEMKRLLTIAAPETKLFAGASLALLAGTIAQLTLPAIMGVIIDTISNPQPQYTLGMIMVGVGGVFGLQMITTFFRYTLLNLASEKIIKRLRENVFANLVKQDVTFFDQNKTGELINRLSSDTAIMGKTMTANLANGLKAVVEGIGGIALLLFIAPKLTLIMLSIVPPITLGSMYYGRFIKKLSKSIQSALAATTAVAEERVSNIRTVKSFVQEEREVNRYKSRVEEVFGFARSSIFATGFFISTVHFVGGCALLTILGAGGHFVQTGAMTIGQLTSFLLYSVTTVSSIGSISSFYGDVMTALGASSRVFELLDRKAETKAAGTRKLETIRGEISLENVGFTYATRADRKVLDQVNLTVPEGQVLALVGPSGSGKSTVSSLISRFYEPQEGKIKLDGVDINDLDENWLRENIGLVAQDVTLFQGTLAENIAYGVPGKTQADIEAAAKEANAHDFIMGFSQGYSTLVGPKGRALSGGQAQRIAIARALLKNPKVLILDEATSALDAESEYLIQQALERLMVGRTVIVIAHRLSTIRHASQICVLSAGKIVESGTFEELMKVEGGVFQQLVQLQTRELS